MTEAWEAELLAAAEAEVKPEPKIEISEGLAMSLYVAAALAEDGVSDQSNAIEMGVAASVLSEVLSKSGLYESAYALLKQARQAEGF